MDTPLEVEISVKVYRGDEDVEITFALQNAGDVARLCDYWAGEHAGLFKEQLVNHVTEALLMSMEEEQA